MSEKVVLKAEDFRVTEQADGDGVEVTGLALPFDTKSRNGVIYDGDSVEAAADTMEGNSVLFNHNEDLPVGHVEAVEAADGKMNYKMDVDPQSELEDGVSVARKLKRGDIKHVSIQALVEPVEQEKGDDGRRVEVVEFLELSLVTIPGFPQTDVMPEHLQKQGFVPVTEAVGDNTVSERSEQDGGGDEDVEKEPFAGYSDHDECVADNQDKDDPDAFCQWLKDKVDAGPDGDGDDEDTAAAGDGNNSTDSEGVKNTEAAGNNTMSEDNTEEAFSDLDERDMFDFIASHYESLSVDDVAALYEDASFAGWDEREVAALVANALDASTGDVLDMFEEVSGEAADDEDPEDDEPEEGSEGESGADDGSNEEDADSDTAESVEELQEKVKDLQEKLQEAYEDDEPEDSNEASENTATANESIDFRGAFPKL